MKTNLFAWISSLLFVCLAIVWWRQAELRDEISELRTELGAVASPHTNRVQVSESTYSVRVNEPPIARADAFEARDERIAELERVVNAQADLLDKLMGRFAQIDEQRRRAAARAWGPEQAVGAPDTMSPGDHRSAWAPAVADGGVEWIEAEFENPTDLAQVVVRQTCNPGTITRVVAITDTGAEVEIWNGEDPSKGQRLSDTPFAAPSGLRAQRVRVYMDTAKLPGWEEIDALKIVGRGGSQQWARSVNASSTYAGGVVLSGENLGYSTSNFLIGSERSSR
jgi:hypothetical protein